MQKTCKIRCASAAFVVASLAAQTFAGVEYTYENDNKTYVANVTSAETAISDEAIAVLNANEVTNFVVRGSARLDVNKGCMFIGDVHATTALRISAAKALGVGPGKIYVTTKQMVMDGGTVEKEVSFDCGTGWDNSTKITAYDNKSSVFKKKVAVSNRNLTIYPYKNSRVVFEGGLEGPGYLPIREAKGGTIVFTNMPINISCNYPLEFIANEQTADSSGFATHFIFAVAGNSLKRWGHPDRNRPIFHELKTTVDWAFNNSSMPVHLDHDSKWDLCGTSQRIGYLNVVCSSGNASTITNSSDAAATLYVTQTANATPAAVFGGNLSVDFSGNKTTTISYTNTAKGEISVNAGTLAFSENGSWANATNVTVNGSAKISLASPNALGRKANVNLAANSSLEIASGVTLTVRTLTVGGVQQLMGDYTFGGGTLRVTHPSGFILSFR